MDNERLALVSGGNRGIGLEVCRQLAERGYAVIMGSRDEENGRVAAEGLEWNVIPQQLDVAYAGSVDRMAAFLEDEFGRLDILVNNAGISNDEGQRGVDADGVEEREAAPRGAPQAAVSICRYASDRSVAVSVRPNRPARSASGRMAMRFPPAVTQSLNMVAWLAVIEMSPRITTS